MRLGINARRLGGQRLGVARYIEYLAKHWVTMLEASDSVTLFVREPLLEKDHSLLERLGVALLRPPFTGLTWEHVHLPPQARSLDVLFCPSYTVPLNYHGPVVLANHSMNEVQSGTHPWWYRWTYGELYRRSAHKADVVIVPSYSTKEDMERHYGVPSKKIEVVPQGVDPSFRPLDSPDEARAVRHRYFGTDRPYILFVGKLSQRRNIPTLIEAFSLLRSRENIPHGLLLVGPNHLKLPLDALARDLGVADRVVQTDGNFADHGELVGIYSAADMYVNPSSYEGFSITLVEAMACGVPVVTVGRAALREIAEGSALLTQNPSAEAIADGIWQVLSDPALRGTLRAEGIRRAGAFRWEDTARHTLEILRRTADA